MAWSTIWIRTSITSIIWWTNHQQDSPNRKSQSTSLLVNKERLVACQRSSVMRIPKAPRIRIGISWKRCMKYKVVKPGQVIDNNTKNLIAKRALAVKMMKKVTRHVKSTIHNKNQVVEIKWKRHHMVEFPRKIKEIRLHKRMMPQMMMKVTKIALKNLNKKRVSKRAHNSRKRNDNTWMRVINGICIT